VRLNILAFVAGVVLLQWQAQLPELAWAWGLPLLAAAWGLPSASRLRRGLLLVFWLALGFFYAAFFAHQRLLQQLPKTWEGVDVSVVGVVASLPVSAERGQRFEFDVEKVLTAGAVVPPHVQLSTYTRDFVGQPVPDAITVHAGQRWQFTVRLRRPHANQNPHVMDMETVWFSRDIRALGSVRERSPHLLLSNQVRQFPYVIDMVREQIASRFDTVLAQQPYVGVLKALAIGDQSAIPAAQWQLYQRTGITHIISISGSHVTMLAGLMFALVYFIWRRSARLTLYLPARRAAVLAGAVTATGYVLLAGFGVPAQRTLYMLWVVALLLWSGRTLAPSRILAWALLVVVLLDPWAVLAAGFWLSFGAVGVLLYATGARVGDVHWLRAWWQSQWAVTLALAPVLLLLFGQVSTVSPLANALAIPLISFLVTPLALLGSIPYMDWALHSAHALMAACVWSLQQFAALPMWTQAQPAVWQVLLALAGALWMLLPGGFPARWLGAIWMLPALLVTPQQPKPGELWVDAIDVGQGLSVLVRTAHHALLFDTGPQYTSTADTGNRILAPYLRGEGVTQLDALVLSHDDNDHTGGATSLLQSVSIARIYTSLPETHTILAGTHVDISRCLPGQRWQWDGVAFEMLYPSLASYSEVNRKDNHRSCVMKVSGVGGSVLLTADIEAEDERYLLANERDKLASTVLVAPHHGSRTSSTPEFIDVVRPRLTVFTVGYQNRFGHPRGDVVARYAQAGSSLARSDRDGLVAVRFTPDHIMQVQYWRQQQQHYWWDDGYNK
jgi:competence protein ComEC